MVPSIASRISKKEHRKREIERVKDLRGVKRAAAAVSIP